MTSHSPIASGHEYLVDADGCDPHRLRAPHALERIVDRLIHELTLHPIGTPLWHLFPAPGGVTALVLLGESHLALHTFPETGRATFNLYCCQRRAEWPWGERLREELGAARVVVRSIERFAAGHESAIGFEDAARPGTP